jgi:hypothetical protein
MRWITLSLSILISSQLLSAQTFEKKFDDYESNKKEMAVGYLWSGVVPGGGLFYAENNGNGLLFLASGIVLYSVAINGIKESPQSAGNWLLLTGIFKAVELYMTTEAIDEYNKDLRRGLKLTLDFKNNYKGLKLSYNF